MSQRDAMYRTVCQHPHDDTPRLVLADHLEESGEPARAAFIRVQCELASSMGLTEVRHDELRERERELFAEHGREWFGAGSLLIPPPQPTVPCRLIRRGFPSHWHGTWEEWAGGECRRCRGRGSIHNDMHHSDDTCTACHGAGRIPGACHRAWKPSWTMECEACWQYGQQWYDCKACGNTGRVPMPMPGDALPITDVTLTTWPGLRRGRDAMGRAIAALPVNRVEHFAEYAGRLTSEVVRELLAAEWPGLVFHLPQEVPQ